MVFVGPGAIKWVPAVLPARAYGDSVAVVLGFVLGVGLFLLAATRPRTVEVAAVRYAPTPELSLRPIEPAPPAQTLVAPYGDGSARGTVILPKHAASGQVGIMVLPYGHVPPRREE